MNRRSFSNLAVPALAGLGLMAGCPDRTISEVIPSQGGALTKQIPVSADIDILFVIDNSSSTLDKQTIFAQNFPKFVAALDAFPTGRPNLHIGVVDTTVDLGVPFNGCPTPDPGDNGLLQNTAHVTGCTPPTGQFISDIADGSGSGRIVNYTGTLEDELSCIAQVGTSGCGFEAQLESMKRALDGSKTQNQGFIRDGAYLAIIFLTDEDDASVKPGAAGSAVFTLDQSTVGGLNDYRVQPLFAYKCDQPLLNNAGGTYTNCKPRTDSYLQDPNYYSTFLAGVKDPEQVVIAVIAGPPPGLSTNDNPPLTGSSADSVSVGSLQISGQPQPQALALQPSCTATINGNPAIGRPAVRLASFLANYGDRGKFYSICQSDYSPALTDIGKTLFNVVSPCLEGAITPTDLDPNNPGTQLDCTVVDVVNSGSASEVDTSIPTCKMATATTVDPSTTYPCWWINNDPVSCPAPDTGFELKIERNGVTPPSGDIVSVECAISS